MAPTTPTAMATPTVTTPTATTPTSTAPTTPTATARTTRSPPNPTKVRAHPLHHQVVALCSAGGSRGAALADSASHEFSDGDAAAACSALCGSAVLRRCQRALQLLLHDGGVRASTAPAAAPDARVGPFPLSDLILLARAAACSAAVPQLSTALRVRQACLRAGVQAVDVIVKALAGIRSAVDLRRKTDRRRRQSQRAKHGRNDAAAALDQLYATDWSDLLTEAEYLNRSDEHAVQQLPDKIRAAGHVTAEDVKSCVEIFRVDDDMILKVRDIVFVARRKLLPRGCALMTREWSCRPSGCMRCARRVVVPAIWLHARAPAWLCDALAARSCWPSGCIRAHPMCELRTFALVSCARVARSRSPSRYVVRAAGETPPKLNLSVSSARLALRAHFGATHSQFPLLDPPGRVVAVVVAAAAAVVLLLCRYGTVRSFNLEHHAILFPRTPAASVWSFTAAALEGALTGALQAFRVLLVGPETHLERAALQLDDVRLRPAVVHNFLLLLHQLHGHHGEPPATFAQVAELLARVPPEERVRRCLQRVVVDTSKDINGARRRSVGCCWGAYADCGSEARRGAHTSIHALATRPDLLQQSCFVCCTVHVAGRSM